MSKVFESYEWQYYEASHPSPTSAPSPRPLMEKTLEEKKGVRDELKTLEKMAMRNVQEKDDTLEMYTKVCEKLSKHFSKISALHETSTAAKASEKEVKAQKAKISDQSLETKTLRIKAAEWQSKVLETEDLLKAKIKERDQRIGDNKQKRSKLKYEAESQLKGLADRERETEEKIAKAADLCSQADSVEVAGRKKPRKSTPSLVKFVRRLTSTWMASTIP